MSGLQILVLAFAGIGLLATLAIFSVALRPREAAARPAVGRLDRRARRRDRSETRRRPPREEGEEVPEMEVEEAPPPPDPLETRQQVDPEEYGVTRRQFFNRGLLGIFGLFLAQFGIASLAFMWPRIRPGGFGGRVIAGEAARMADEVFTPDGRVSPLFIPAAAAYIVPFQGDVEGTSFEGLPVIAGGLMALWQRCVHLGCRVPQCDASQGFECPCHGSRYNYHGEYEGGPAPRNLDRFAVTIDDAGQFVIDTGTILQTARSLRKSAEYPRGPSCI